MPEVKTYDTRVSPIDPGSPRATPESFGSSIAQSMQQFGQSQLSIAEGKMIEGAGQFRLAASANDIAQHLYAMESQDESTKVHVWAATKRAEWQQRFTELETTTDPGDKTFVNRVQDAMKDDFTDFKKTLTTRGGNERADIIYSDMRGMFGQEAISAQSRLVGINVKNQNNEIITKLSATVGNDPSQLEGVINQYKLAVMDNGSNFARAELPVRQALIQDGVEKLRYSAAQGFIRRNPSAALEGLDPAAHDAIRDIASNPPTPGMPVNLHAEGLAPFTKDQLSAYANKIDAPSPYDADFKAAATKYGVNWRELKMRSIVESGLENKEKNSAGAMGVMQITGETAAAWGINAMNPNQSIMAAARNLAKYQLRAGGDMSKVDMMYHGGPDGEGTAYWGPKTRQYAANMSALRQTAGIISTSNPETLDGINGPIDIAHQSAVNKTVGNRVPGFAELPWHMQSALLTSAEHYQRAAQAQQTRAQAEQMRIDKEVQESSMGDFIRRALNPAKFGGAPNEQEIADSNLEPSQKMTIQNFLTTHEANRLRADKDNPEEMVSLIKRIEAQPDDPKRINSLQQLIDVYGDGKISESELMRLEARLSKRKEGGTTLTKKMSQAFSLANSAFRDSATDPYEAASYTSRWSDTVETLIANEEKAGRDPMDLFNPRNKNYVLGGEFLRSFAEPPELQLANGAKRALQAAEANRQTQNPNLKVNDLYNVNGKRMRYIGGPMNDRNSWQSAEQ